MKTLTALRVLSFLLLIALPALPGRAASFSAELADTMGGETYAGTFQYQNGSYRFETGPVGQKLIVLVDGSTGTTRLLNSVEKAYVEAKAGEPMSLFASPFALYAQYAKVKEVRTEGTESVGGVVCRKLVVHGGEQIFVTGWVADGYELPLRVQTQLDGRTVELRNIKPGPQDPALFTVPAEYRLKVMEERRERQPEWAGQVAAAPLLTAPFERSLPEGGIVRVRTKAGRWVEIAGTNTGQGEGALMTAAFKDGKYAADGSMSTLILTQGDGSAVSYGVQPDAADEIVIRVSQGAMKVRTAYVAEKYTGSKPDAAEPAPEAFAELTFPAAADMAAPVEVDWTGPGAKDDFITVARPAQPAGSFDNRAFVRNGNPAKVWAPGEPGEYEVRYILGRGSKLLAKSPLTVTAVPAKVTPAGPVKVAGWIEVTWEGPARDGDIISVASPGQAPGASLARTAVKEGNPLKVRAPSDAGTFEVRYILGRGNRLLASAPVTINAVTATVSPPTTAVAGAEFEVSWQGPGYPEDLIVIARADQPPGANLSSAPVRKGNPLKIRAPKQPGAYEVRYILGRGHRLLAKVPLTVTAP